MDLNYIKNLVREDIKKKCPHISNEIIEEYLYLSFFRSGWCVYGDNKDFCIIGIAKGKYDFYYIGLDNDYNVQLISCACDIKINKDRDKNYIPPFEENFKEWSKKSNKIWKQIKKDIKEYFKNNPQDKLIYSSESSIFNES